MLSSVPAEAGFMRAMSGKANKNVYIVTLRDSVGAEQVDIVARGLANEHSGRVVATMKNALRGFGVVMTEARARALAKHPLVAQVEEDEEMQLSSEPLPVPEFEFRAANRKPAEPAAKKRERELDFRTMWNSESGCGWNGSYYLCSFSDDTFWHLDRLDNSGLMYSTKAYAYVSTGAGVRAYVLDSGVWFDHQEFGQSPRQVETGANMLVDGDNYDALLPGEEATTPLDAWSADYPCGQYRRTNASHGTAVASVLAGKFTGVAKDATIVPVKVISCGGHQSKLAFARGLDWVVGDMQNRPGTRAVVSISTYVDPSEAADLCETAVEGQLTNCRSAIEATVNNVIGANIPVVVSANNQNNGDCVTSPARMGYGNEANFASTHRTITVGGTQALAPGYVDQRWDCNNGPDGCAAFPETNAGSNFGPCVSIYAPAYRVRVAGWEGPTSYRPFPFDSGTSYSAPYVAGIIARLLSTPAYANYTPYQLWLEVRNRAIGRNVQPADFDPSPGTTRTWLAYMPATQ